MNPNTRRSRNPQHGGNLGINDGFVPLGWPEQLLPATAQGWYDRRVIPYHGNYGLVWTRYLAAGRVAEIDPAILDEANHYWSMFPSTAGHGSLTSETPWTQADSAGVIVNFAAAYDDDAPVTPEAEGYSRACGWILHHYWQLDLGKMVRKIANKLQET